MRIDRSEFRKGVAKTTQYLLSHHERSEWDRCYTLDVLGWRVRLCARCTGIYPGIIAGLVLYLTTPLPVGHYLLIGVLPMPALIDWTLSAFTPRRGRNPVRTVTGAALGCGYGIGLGFVLGEFDVGVLAIGAGYAFLAGLLLYLRQ